MRKIIISDRDHICITTADEGYRIVEDWEKKEYDIPECVMYYDLNKKRFKKAYYSYWRGDIIYQVPTDFEFEEEYYYFTGSDEFEKPEFAEVQLLDAQGNWCISKDVDWNKFTTYRIPLSRKSELVSKWIEPTDEMCEKFGRLKCQVKDVTWENGILLFVKNHQNFKFKTTEGDYQACRVLKGDVGL